jgi:hypothetical protein
MEVGRGQRGDKLRAALKGVRTLAGFDLDELGHQLEAFALNEPGDGFALGFEGEARAALLAGVDAKIADQRLWHGGGLPECDCQSLYHHLTVLQAYFCASLFFATSTIFVLLVFLLCG